MVICQLAILQCFLICGISNGKFEIETGPHPSAYTASGIILHEKGLLTDYVTHSKLPGESKASLCSTEIKCCSVNIPIVTLTSS